MTIRKKIFIALGIVALASLVWAGVFAWKNFRGAGPAFSKPATDITKEVPASNEPAQNNTNMPLSLPNGFAISIFAKNIPGARVMALDSFGNMWVSQTSKGTISEIEIKDGKVSTPNVVFKNLNNPHGLAFDPENPNLLYFAESNKISKVTLYSDDSPHKVADLPGGGEHVTRTIGFGPDHRLYISIGSTCNACNESNPMRAAIYSMNKDGSDVQPVASGLRNSVFFVWQSGQMWATDNGRDYLGDNVPPDEVNVIQQGKNYGWPICYGQNIHDTNFDKNTYIQNPCNGKVAPKVELQAHSAPLGLAFVPAGKWPDQYKNNLLVAFHGSWNRSQSTGFKVVSVKFDDQGNYQSTQDFITGWLPKGGVSKGALGRPVDLLFGKDGTLYLSDDKVGVIYRVVYTNK